MIICFILHTWMFGGRVQIALDTLPRFPSLISSGDRHLYLYSTSAGFYEGKVCHPQEETLSCLSRVHYPVNINDLGA